MPRKPARSASDDHGLFRIRVPSITPAMVEDLMDRAAKNTQHPGEAWAQFTADTRGEPTIGHRIYHLDLHARVIVMTEVWDGYETARKTLELDEINE